MIRDWMGGRPLVYASTTALANAPWMPTHTGPPWGLTPAWRWWCPACLTDSRAHPTRLHAMTDATGHAASADHAAAVGHPYASTMAP